MVTPMKISSTRQAAGFLVRRQRLALEGDDVKARVTYDPTLKDPEAQRRQAGQILDVIDDVLTDHNFLYPPGDYDVTSLRAALAPEQSAAA